MNLLCRLLIWWFCACLMAFGVKAHWKKEYAKRGSEVRA